MAKLTNVSPDDREVPRLAEHGLPPVIKAGETVEVPDDLVAHEVDGEQVGYAWPPETWKVEPDKPAAKAAGKAKE